MWKGFYLLVIGLLAIASYLIPLTLTLPTVNGEPVKLSIPPSLVQEWQTVANY